MSADFTQERFAEELNTGNAFAFEVTCKKCGCKVIDLHFDPGHVYSEYTAESASLRIWCTNCKTETTKYL